MRRVIGRILLVLGWVCAGWFGVVGGSFTSVYLLGFVGTGGREAGDELMLVGGLTLLGVFVGWALIKVGSRLAKQA